MSVTRVLTPLANDALNKFSIAKRLLAQGERKDELAARVVENAAGYIRDFDRAINEDLIIGVRMLQSEPVGRRPEIRTFLTQHVENAMARINDEPIVHRKINRPRMTRMTTSEVLNGRPSRPSTGASPTTKHTASKPQGGFDHMGRPRNDIDVTKEDFDRFFRGLKDQVRWANDLNAARRANGDW